MKLKIKKVRDDAIIPKRGSEYAAGIDLYAADDAVIESGKMIKISAGIAFEIPTGYFGAIYARSGMATKNGLRPANCVGVVDSDFRSDVIIPLYNDSNEKQIIYAGTRIAQMIIQECPWYEIEEVEELSETKRGTGGFGSTGVN